MVIKSPPVLHKLLVRRVGGANASVHGQKSRTPSIEARGVETKQKLSGSLEKLFLLYLHFIYSVSIFLIPFVHLFLFCCFSTFSLLHGLIFRVWLFLLSINNTKVKRPHCIRDISDPSSRMMRRVLYNRNYRDLDMDTASCSAPS